MSLDTKREIEDKDRRQKELRKKREKERKRERKKEKKKERKKDRKKERRGNFQKIPHILMSLQNFPLDYQTHQICYNPN